MIYKRFLKRILDFIFSLIALLGLSPIIIILGILIRVKLGSPIIFKQKRPGINEKIFTMYKFRTMTNEKNANGELLTDGDRLTNFGKMLRSTSLDELPELYNILKGDMSIIGPRPLLIEYLPRYNNFQKRRHKVKPGLSGLAQVSGRNTMSWECKFNKDIEYVNNMNWLMDLKIFLLTIKKVIERDGISSETSVTMEKFLGKI